MADDHESVDFDSYGAKDLLTPHTRCASNWATRGGAPEAHSTTQFRQRCTRPVAIPPANAATSATET